MAEKVEKPKEAKSTPEAKLASETSEETTGTPKETAPESQVSDELAKMKSELGRLKQELGEGRKEIEDLKPYKLHYEQSQQQPQPQQQMSQEDIIKQYNERWFDNPAQMAQMQQQSITANISMQMANQAKALAKIQNPEAFEGIDEQKVEQAMFGGARTGTVNPGMLSDPNAWVGTAWIIRGQELGYRVPSASPQNLQPTDTERPGAPKPDTGEEIPDIQGDALTEALISELMKADPSIKTKEDALREIQATRDGGMD